MAAIGGDHGFHAGDGEKDAFSEFLPQGWDLIEHFLLPRMASEPLPPAGRFIHDAGICSAFPSVLAEAHAPAPIPAGDVARPATWYFFSPALPHCESRDMRYSRRVHGRGLWCRDGEEKMVEKGGGVVWYIKPFRFLHNYKGTDWVMVEYGIDEEAGNDLVLCQVFSSPTRRRLFHIR